MELLENSTSKIFYGDTSDAHISSDDFPHCSQYNLVKPELVHDK